MGLCHCGFFIDRLYDYEGSGSPDPTMEPNVLNTLQQKCPPHLVTIDNITEDSIVFMNQVSSAPFHFDNSLYHALLNEKAVLQIDQELAFTDVTSKLAAQYANNPGTFMNQFTESMIKLGSIGVLTGQEGEIRLNCRVVNNATSNSSTANFGPEN